MEDAYFHVGMPIIIIYHEYRHPGPIFGDAHFHLTGTVFYYLLVLL